MRKVRAFLWVALVVGTLLTLAGCDRDQPQTIMPDTGPSPAGSPDDAAVAPTKAGEKAQLALYVMSECPYGVPAEKLVYKVSEVLPRELLDTHLAFIVNDDGAGGLRSLHGPAELQKNMVQACAGTLAPEKELAFVVAMNDTGKPWAEIAPEMAIDPAAIQRCLDDGTGEKLMREDLAETANLGVTSSPTILINGKEYNGGRSSLDLFDALCQSFGDARPDVCKTPPEELSRTDGTASGSCGKQAAPTVPDEMTDKTAFTHTVIVDPNALDNSRLEQVLAQTQGLFPNMKVERVASDSDAGKRLIAKYDIRQLPAFLFPADLDKRSNFQVIQPHVVQVKDVFMLAPQIGGTIFETRERAPKRLDVFFTPFSPNALRVLLDLKDLLARPDVQALGLDLRLLPYARSEEGQIAAAMGPPEIEEMLRVIAIEGMGKDKVWDYLRARYENPMSSWWEDYAKKAGLDPAQVKKVAQDDRTAETLATNSNLATELGIGDDIAVLVENREVARIEGKDQFREMLFKLGKR